MKKMIRVFLTDRQHQRLEDLAEDREMTAEQFVRELIEVGLISLTKNPPKIDAGLRNHVPEFGTPRTRTSPSIGRD